MSAPGSKPITVGLTVMLVSLSAAMHLGAGGFSLLLYFTGVLVGAILVAAGVRMATGPAPILPVVLGGARALAVFGCHNTGVVGLVRASCAFTAVSDEEDPVLCSATFALLLLGVAVISIGARGE